MVQMSCRIKRKTYQVSKKRDGTLEWKLESVEVVTLEKRPDWLEPEEKLPFEIPKTKKS